MAKKDFHKQLFPLLKTSIDTFASHPIILYPLCVTVFIQLLVLEILYFSPRFPLVVFFGPVIRHWGDAYLHYPLNFVLLPKLFYYAQTFIFIFIGSFLNAVTILLIAAVNNDRKLSIGAAIKECLPSYVHIFIAAVMYFCFFMGFISVYHWSVQKFLSLGFLAGMLPILQKIIVSSEPYVNLFLGVCVMTLFVFVIPVIVIEKKKVTTALIENLKILWRSSWFMFLVVLIPTLLYVPILLLSGGVSTIGDNFSASIYLIVIALSVVVTLFIDATVFTATTTFYLLKKENK